MTGIRAGTSRWVTGHAGLCRASWQALGLASVILSVRCATAVLVEEPTDPSAQSRQSTRFADPNLAGAAPAESASASSATATRCSNPAARAFDFWIGHWEVRRPDGSLAGYNEIEAILDGCVLEERYTTVDGKYRGTSLNIYDAGRGLWHQSWVDNGGLLLMLDGRFEAGVMRLSGQTLAADGTATLQEISWTALEDGRVRQHWRSSADDGATWQDAFIGLYSRRAAKAGS